MKFNAFTATPSRGFSIAGDLSMRTGRVDQVSSVLLSLILLIGLSVGVLGLLFFMRQSAHEPIIDRKPIDQGSGQNGKPFEQDLDVPAQEEVDQLNEPAVEQSLRMLTEVISSVAGSLENIESKMNDNSFGTGGSIVKRLPGAEGRGGEIAPRNERWILKFTARDKRSYARQLESFKINIGVIGGGIATVDYVSNVASAPGQSSGTSKDFRGVLYFISVTSNILEQYERQILNAAGVTIAGRQVLKFVPKETEELLAQVEANYYLENRSKDLRISDIVGTIFECRPKKESGGYEFVVVDQRYRPP